MMRIFTTFSVLLASLVWPLPGLGEEISLVTGERFEGILRSLKEDGSAAVWTGERGLGLEPGKLVRVRYGSFRLENEGEGLWILLRGGTILFGVPEKKEAATALSVTGLCGEALIPLDAVQALRYHPPPGSAHGPDFGNLPEAGSDVVLIREGDGAARLSGVVKAVGPGGVRLSVKGEDLDIGRAKIAGVLFGETRKFPALEEGNGFVKAQLLDGNRIVGRILGLEWGVLRIRTRTGLVFELPVAALSELELGTDRRKYVSDLDPLTVSEVPFFGRSWPHRRDRSVAGNPLRLGSTDEYAKGLGVHARSRITFRVPDGFRRFVSVIGIDDETRGKGNAVFRVLLDGEVVFEKRGVRGGDPPAPVDIPLKGASTITLEVDFGEELDVGDHGDWADARFLKD